MPGVPYATHPDGRTCILEVIYNHSTTPEFMFVIGNPVTMRAKSEYGHPKRNGITKKNGWKVNPDYTGAW